eukprot:scaffold293482_cov25-Prasinocladus_malaysianus.AAC.1
MDGWIVRQTDTDIDTLMEVLIENQKKNATDRFVSKGKIKPLWAHPSLASSACLCLKEGMSPGQKTAPPARSQAGPSPSTPP